MESLMDKWQRCILDILTIYVSERSEKICAELSDRIATRAYERR